MRKPKRLYLVLCEITSCKTVENANMNVNMTEPSTGIAGVMPFFTNEKKAKKWARGREIITLSRTGKQGGEA